MAIKVRIPTPLQKLTGQKGEVEVNASSVKELVTALENVDIEKVIKEASVMPVAKVQPVQQEAKKEEKKEEKKSDEAAVAGLGALFG